MGVEGAAGLATSDTSDELGGLFSLDDDFFGNTELSDSGSGSGSDLAAGATSRSASGAALGVDSACLLGGSTTAGASG